jgi:DNA-binding transcriptional regulator YiaG
MKTKTEMTQTFGMSVRAVRFGHNLTRSELAEGFYVSPETVRHWEYERQAGLHTVLRVMFHADPSFARVAQEIWLICT